MKAWLGLCALPSSRCPLVGATRDAPLRRAAGPPRARRVHGGAERIERRRRRRARGRLYIRTKYIRAAVATDSAPRALARTRHGGWWRSYGTRVADRCIYQEGFTIMRRRLSTAALRSTPGLTKESSRSSYCAFGVLILYWPAVAYLFGWFEPSWTVQDTMYFMVLTLTTVGYGDVTPSSWQGRLLAVFYMLFNVCCLSFFIHKVVSFLAARRSAYATHSVEETNELEESVEAEASIGAAPEMEDQGFINPTVRTRTSGLTGMFRSNFKTIVAASDSMAGAVADAHEATRRASVKLHVCVTLLFFFLGTAGFRYMGFGGCEEPACDFDVTTDGTAECLPGCVASCWCTQDAAAQYQAARSSESLVDSIVGETLADEDVLVNLRLDFSDCPAACMNTSTCEGSATPIPRRKGRCEIAAFLAGNCGTTADRMTSCSEYQEWVDALYVATYTLTTVGFGDIAGPKHWHGRLFTMGFSVVGTTLLTTAVANAVNYLFNKARREEMLSMFSNPRYLKILLRSMDTDGDMCITELEFMQYMLVQQNKATREDFEILHDQFVTLDVDNSGTLTFDDIKQEIEHTAPADSEGT